MPDRKFKYVPFVTEVMTARYPKLSEPDMEGEYADGKYKTEATATADYTQRFQAEIQAHIDRPFACKKSVHVPWKETRGGAIAFIFKSPSTQPELMDAKGNPLKAGVVIWDGSLIRVSGLIAAWQKGAKRGVSLWPGAVRVIKLAKSFEVSEPTGCPSWNFNASWAFGPPEDGYDGSGPPHELGC